MSDYLRFPNGQRVEGSIFIDADDPFADIVDSELYEPDSNTFLVSRAGQAARVAAWRNRTQIARMRVVAPPSAAAIAPSPTDIAMLVSKPRTPIVRARAARPAALRQFVPPSTSAAIVPRGPAGSAVFIANFEEGATVTYSWKTDVMRTLLGAEYRVSGGECPRETYSFACTLDDSEFGYAQNALFLNNAIGNPFLLGLMHEGAILSDVSTATVATVGSTDRLDWIDNGQRVIVYNPTTHVYMTSWVIGFGANTITLHDAIGAVGSIGSIIMPAMACLCDAAQPFGHYPVNAQRWEIKATAILFGNAQSLWSPRGATLTTYDGGGNFTIPPPVWNIPFKVDQTSARTIDSGSEILDRGGSISAFGQLASSDIARQVEFTVRDDYARQWVKAFLGYARGQQCSWWLPTWKPDFTVIGDASTANLTFSFPDYIGQWFASTAHQWLQLLMADGSIHYAWASSPVDNGDGTQTVTLDNAFVGAIARISFLELVRFAQDDFTIKWRAGGIGDLSMQARTHRW